MSIYLVKFSLGMNNDLIYPAIVKHVTWKFTLYHHIDNVMIGETDDEIEADGIEVIALSPDDAQKLIKKYRSHRPDTGSVSEEISIPRRA